MRPENRGLTYHQGFNLPKQGAYAVDLAGRRLQEAAEDIEVITNTGSVQNR